MCSHEVCASNTRSRGASNCRVSTSSSSPRVVTFNSRSAAAMFPLLPFHLLEISVELVVAFLPERPVGLRPVGHVLDGLRPQARRPTLRLPAAGDEAGPLQHLEVLRDRGLAH